MMLTRRFRRPRCGIPITTSLQPTEPARWINSFTIGMKDSPPSTPKRFAPTNLLPRYFSRPSAAVKRSRTCFSDQHSGHIDHVRFQDVAGSSVFFGIHDMHVFSTDRATVSRFHHLDHFAQSRCFLTNRKVTGIEYSVQIRLS